MGMGKGLAIAEMEVPPGPVTEMHWPQWSASSQLESERAVPKRPVGRVKVEKEQVPPGTLPP